MNQPVFGSRLYLDANIYIYVFEQHQPQASKLGPVFDHLDQDGVELIASEIMLTELLTKPLKNRNTALEDQYRTFFESTQSVEMVPVDRRIAHHAAILRSEHGLKSMDALHMATAIVEGASCFVTADAALRKVTEITVLTLDDLTP